MGGGVGVFVGEVFVEVRGVVGRTQRHRQPQLGVPRFPTQTYHFGWGPGTVVRWWASGDLWGPCQRVRSSCHRLSTGIPQCSGASCQTPCTDCGGVWQRTRRSVLMSSG